MIFLWKIIKNTYSAIKNLKKLWLQAKFSNFWMQLVLIKNILWFSHNKLDKHLISSKKDPSRVPMFVSHNGTLCNNTTNNGVSLRLFAQAPFFLFMEMFVMKYVMFAKISTWLVRLNFLNDSIYTISRSIAFEVDKVPME